MTLQDRKIPLRGFIAAALIWQVFVPTAPRGLEARTGSEWSPLVNVGAAINSPFEELSPHIAADGLTLYFASNRPDSQGGEDLWVSRRDSVYDPWEAPRNLGPVINTAGGERSPSLSRNGRLLFYVTDRAGGFGNADIWMSWRSDPNDDLGWQPPVNLGTGINSSAADAGPNFFEGAHRLHQEGIRATRGAIPQLFTASNRAGGLGFLDIYVGSVPGGWAGPAVLLSDLSSSQNDVTPSIRRDGLEIFIASTRNGTIGSLDLWRSVRKRVGDSWSTPENLGPAINTPAVEMFPSLSFDGDTLYFQSNRPEGFGGNDIYVSTRHR